MCTGRCQNGLRGPFRGGFGGRGCVAFLLSNLFLGMCNGWFAFLPLPLLLLDRPNGRSYARWSDNDVVRQRDRTVCSHSYTRDCVDSKACEPRRNIFPKRVAAFPRTFVETESGCDRNT